MVKSRILPEGWIDLPLCHLPLESKAYHPYAHTLIRFPREIHILDCLRKSPHPHLMELLHFFEEEGHYYIVSELVDQGLDLFDFIDKTPTFLTPALVQAIFWQVMKAVMHLQAHHILHRDIKDENIIIDMATCQVKLIDFGSATFFTPGKKFSTFCGTMDYAAPEVLRGRGYEGPKQEVWALGILFYTLLFKESPFRNMNQILYEPLAYPSHAAACREEAIQLVEWMLQKEANQRPTFEQILAHAYFHA